jgi:energy-coupling factor transport system substrate-specific component
MTARPRVVRIGPRPAIAIALASLAGLAMFVWPLLWHPASGGAHRVDAPFVFILIMPALVAVVVAELSDGGMDAKTLAMLGVLAALGAALRPLGAGTAGIETVFFLLVLAGRVYGAGFGFVLGATTMFASSLLTGGVGPWLPFQMLGASWVGMGAGLLPRAAGRRELALLATYGAVSAYVFGTLLNLFFWPFATGTGGSLSFVPGASVATNLHRFVLYCGATSTWGWDTGRAITTVLAIVIVGPALLVALRRASRKAAFDARVSFAPT